jgi:hypothetical protein
MQPTRRPARPIRLALVAASAFLAMSLSGCFGSTRSALAVCKVFDKDAVAFHDRYEQDAQATTQGNVLSTLGDLAAAPSRLAALMDKLDAVAPSEIEPAFKTLADTFGQMAKNQGGGALNPIESLASGLSLALRAQGAFTKANAYLAKHCGRPQ